MCLEHALNNYLLTAICCKCGKCNGTAANTGWVTLLLQSGRAIVKTSYKSSKLLPWNGNSLLEFEERVITWYETNSRFETIAKQASTWSLKGKLNIKRWKRGLIQGKGVAVLTACQAGSSQVAAWGYFLPLCRMVYGIQTPTWNNVQAGRTRVSVCQCKMPAAWLGISLLLPTKHREISVHCHTSPKSTIVLFFIRLALCWSWTMPSSRSKLLSHNLPPNFLVYAMTANNTLYCLLL